MSISKEQVWEFLRVSGYDSVRGLMSIMEGSLNKVYGCGGLYLSHEVPIEPIPKDKVFHRVGNKCWVCLAIKSEGIFLVILAEKESESGTFVLKEVGSFKIP